MKLTTEEQAWLAGKSGPALRRAMEIIVALGNIYGAERLIPVQSVQISGVSYRNLRDAGLVFLERWAEEGARVRVPTTLNPTAMDMQCWEAQGFTAEFAHKQQAVVDAFCRMGVSGAYVVGCDAVSPTCTPYLIGNRPAPGTHVAWAESSAVAFANSVLGARTNREGGPGAIAAALTGRTAAYGLHLEENRRATLQVVVREVPHTIADYSALGALVGQAAHQAVPYFSNLLPVGELCEEKLKALGAAMAATGAVALFHIAGITMEAAPPPPGSETLEIASLAPGYAALSDPGSDVDLVWVGCPHASLPEIARLADRVRGTRLRIPLWVTCARPVRDIAVKEGYAARIEAAGGRVFADACMAIAPVRELGFGAVATPSAKGAYYLRNLARVKARFGPLERCLEAALTGQWEVA